MMKSLSRSSRTSCLTQKSGDARKPNQDGFYVGIHINAVSDGHGPLGDCVSALLINMLRDLDPTIDPNDEAQSVQKIKDFFPLAHSACANIDGGATLIVEFIATSGRVYVVYVGDSSAILINQDGSFTATTDHCPTNPSEYARIKALPSGSGATCVYQTTRNERVPIFDGNDQKFPISKSLIHPSYAGNPDPRVNRYLWNGNPQHVLQIKNIDGEMSAYLSFPRLSKLLAVTRSIGDTDRHQFGVTCIPEVTVGTAKIVIMGSDGLWDAVPKEDLAKIVVSETELQRLHTVHFASPSAEPISHNADLMCKVLMAEGVKRAINLFSAGGTDDITLCVTILPDFGEDVSAQAPAQAPASAVEVALTPADPSSHAFGVPCDNVQELDEQQNKRLRTEQDDADDASN